MAFLEDSLPYFLLRNNSNEDIRFMAGEKTVLTDGDEVAIIPAVAGG
jgi:molybdopterin converting factor small subunit